VQHSGEGRQRRVENGVVDDPCEQAQAEDKQDLLATWVTGGPLLGYGATGFSRSSGGMGAMLSLARIRLSVRLG
jgi:hypothetical protein